MEQNAMHVGDFIRRFRQEIHMSQATLGELVGASAPLISAIENGKQLPTQRMMLFILEALNIEHLGVVEGDCITLWEGTKFNLNSRIGRVPALMKKDPPKHTVVSSNQPPVRTILSCGTGTNEWVRR